MRLQVADWIQLRGSWLAAIQILRVIRWENVDENLRVLLIQFRRGRHSSCSGVRKVNVNVPSHSSLAV